MISCISGVPPPDLESRRVYSFSGFLHLGRNLKSQKSTGHEGCVCVCVCVCARACVRACAPVYNSTIYFGRCGFMNKALV